jgi:oligopeptidase B
MARAAPLLLHDEQEDVDVAVVPGVTYPLTVAGRLPLAPVLLPAPAPVPHAPGLEGLTQGVRVHPGEHQHVAATLLLHDRRHQATGVVLDRRQFLGGRTDRRGNRGARAGVGRGVHQRSSVPVCQTRNVPDLRPPAASRRPEILRHRGDERVDPWYWLRDRDDPEVLAYLEAENAFTRDALEHLAPRREKLFSEIVGRVQETDTSAPVRHGPFEYFSRTREGQQYRVHCRRPAGSDALPDPAAEPGTTPGETVVLDENALARGHEYFAVGDLTTSPDQELVAFSIDTTGGERYELRFRRLSTEGEGADDVDDVVPDVYYGTAWANDNRTVFYTRPDDAMRPWQIWRHVTGTPTADDVLVFQEDDDRFYVSVGRVRTGRYLVISAESKVTTESWLVDADDPTTPAVIVEPRVHGHEYHVDHHVGAGGDRLFVLTNDGGAENFKLVVAPTASPSRGHWQEVLPSRPGVRLDDLDAFRDHLVISERADAVERLRVLRVTADGGLSDDHLIAMPDAVYSTWLGNNFDFDTETIRYQYTSLVAPVSAYDYELATRRATLVKRQAVPGYDPHRYASERAWAIAPDGARIPISIVYRGARRSDEPRPLLLYGYGSYEVSIDPTFSASRVSLLDRGVVFAIAHVRGGGELGRAWYEDGKFLRKRNTFTDFIAAAEHLVSEGWTRPQLLAARGGSAGGLLMGAVANLRPDLFRVVVAEVPFVDVLTTILDETLPLTITEWEEWGDPVHDEAIYALMKSYSPYDNVGARAYPAMLVTGGLNDPRVQYWEPAKWVAKLRSTKVDSNLLVLKMEMGAGHSGPSGRYDAWRDEAFVLAFVLDQLGVEA